MSKSFPVSAVQNLTFSLSLSLSALLLGARTLLGAPGRTTRNKKLLGAPGRTTRNKKLLGAPGRTTRNKKLLGAPGIATRRDATREKTSICHPDA